MDAISVPEIKKFSSENRLFFLADEDDEGSTDGAASEWVNLFFQYEDVVEMTVTVATTLEIAFVADDAALHRAYAALACGQVLIKDLEEHEKFDDLVRMVVDGGLSDAQRSLIPSGLSKALGIKAPE